ncbi:MAG: hypothetical protein CVU60_15775 [Deltaproteobacteria bacterium HGW-Deltaproteobacteria-18]|nr:MAG: hypothetical protein CVU60_15775 [Deltaproteobacteria bacterium HGW-Deltaproteobacteria-18]
MFFIDLIIIYFLRNFFIIKIIVRVEKNIYWVKYEYFNAIVVIYFFFDNFFIMPAFYMESI